MDTKEIVTLQFGHYSNYVGAHWWNLQELSFQYNSTAQSEINHDVLYREGLTTTKEVTFTPRLLLVDLQGSLGSLPEDGDLYEPKGDLSKIQTNWHENQVEVQQVGPSQTKHQFQQDINDPLKFKNLCNTNYNFDKTANVWSDFLYARYHPRTVEVVKGYQHCNQDTPFDAFTLGAAVWKTSQFVENFTDKIRNYIEECDHFQGFHFLTDCTNAFSGLSSSCLEYISDEYDKKSVLVIPVIPSHFSDNVFNNDIEKEQSIINDSVRVVNLALSFNEFTNNSSLFVPLCLGSQGWRQPGPKRILKNVEYDHKLPYHSSAILAASLDTISLKYRLRTSTFTLKDLEVDLTGSGRKAVAASVNIPFPMRENCDLLECLDSWKDPLSQSITPNCPIGTLRMMQHITLRGIKEDQLKKPLDKAQKQRELPAYRSRCIEEMMLSYLAYSTDASANCVTVAHSPLNVKSPFPQIFTKNIGTNGFIADQERLSNNGVESVPLLAGLHSGSEIGGMIESLHTEARKIRISRFHQYTSGDIDGDAYEECLDNLFTLRENYEDSYLI